MANRPPAVGGIGRGRPVNATVQPSPPGASQGFTASANESRGDWDDYGVSQNSGFGGAAGDLSAATNYASGQDESNNFGNNTFGGSNFGSNREAGRACYKCHKTDHIARNCPEGDQGQFGGGGFGGSKSGFGGGGFNNATSGFGGGNGGGFTQSDQKSGFGGNGFGDGGWGQGADSSAYGFESGYGAQDSRAQRGGTGRGRGRGCYNCGDLNHMSRDCNNPKPGGGDRFERRSGPQRDTSRKMLTSRYVPKEVPLDELWKQHIPAGINFDRYYDIKVDVTGEETNKAAIVSFNEAGLISQLLMNVQRAGYTMPTPIQKYAIPYVLAGRDIMACAQTGSGKTAAFLLPILSSMMNSGSLTSAPGSRQDPIMLVVVPTRELAIQIKDEARKFAADTPAQIVTLYGGTDVQSQKATLFRGCNVLVATPGRLLDFIERGCVRLGKCRYLVLDEADRMLDMGFEPSIRKLIENPDMPPKSERQTLMFSATFPATIQDLAREFLNDQVFITVGKVGAANMDIHQEIILAKPDQKKDLLIEYVQTTMNESRGENGIFHKKCVIFVERKRMADFVALELVQGDTPIDAISIHGDRYQEEREEVLYRFKNGISPVLVATDVAARGLDIPDVDHVINYDMPKEISDYVHRIGRTARVGNIGRATSFFDPSSDAGIAQELLKVLVDANQTVPDFLQKFVEGGSLSTFDGGATFNATAHSDW